MSKIKLNLNLLGETSDSLAERFLQRAIKISSFGAEVGIKITPTLNPELLIFRSLPIEQQIAAVQKIDQNCEIFSSVTKNKQDLRNSFSVIWKTLNFLGFRPPSDFFDKLSDEDVVQVYCREGIHRFSNLKFFEVCSYTLEQIYSLPWTDLWKRSEADTKDLLAYVSQILDTEQKTAQIVNMSSHRISEVSSVFRYEANYTLKCIAPLFDRVSGEKSGFIVREGCEILNKHVPSQEERLLLEFDEYFS